MALQESGTILKNSVLLNLADAKLLALIIKVKLWHVFFLGKIIKVYRPNNLERNLKRLVKINKQFSFWIK